MCAQHAFGGRRTADIAEADEQDAGGHETRGYAVAWRARILPVTASTRESRRAGQLLRTGPHVTARTFPADQMCAGAPATDSDSRPTSRRYKYSMHKSALVLVCRRIHRPVAHGLRWPCQRQIDAHPPPNVAPIANAGTNQTVIAASPSRSMAACSSDPDGIDRELRLDADRRYARSPCRAPPRTANVRRRPSPR